MADPLIVHWPARLGTDGRAPATSTSTPSTCMPTLLDLIGIEPPATIDGVEQSPIEGVSFAAVARSTPAAPSDHVTQYYEMLGSRALYHDGWKAVVFHSPPFIAYDGSDTHQALRRGRVGAVPRGRGLLRGARPRPRSEPDKLAELEDLWWAEAAKYQVLPLNNQPGRFGDPRYRRNRYEFFDGVGPLPEALAPNLKNRSFVDRRRARRPGRRAPTDGVHRAPTAATPAATCCYLKDRRLHYTYNFVGTDDHDGLGRGRAAAGPGRGAHDVQPHRRASATAATWRSTTTTCRWARARSRHTTPLTYGTPGFAVGFQPAGPISPDLPGRAQVPAGVLRRIIVESKGRDPLRDGVDRDRRAGPHAATRPAVPLTQHHHGAATSSPMQ